MPNKMLTGDALDMNKKISQDNAFIVVGSTDKGTNENLNND